MLHIGPAGYPPGSKGAVQAVEKVQGPRPQRPGGPVRAEREPHHRAGPGARASGPGSWASPSAPTPPTTSTSTPTRRTGPRARTGCLASLRAADACGGRIVVVHAASYMGKSPEDTTRAVVEGLQRVREVVEEEGLAPDHRAGDHGEDRQLGHPGGDRRGDGRGRGRGAGPRLRPHPCPGAGLPAHRSRTSRRCWTRPCSIHKGRLHCHFSCIEYTDKGEKRHLLLEKKDPDFGHLATLAPEGPAGTSPSSPRPPTRRATRCAC